MITRADLVGEWSLQEFTITDTSGKQVSWRDNCTGLLIYTNNGYMSVSINSNITGDKTLPANKYDSILCYSDMFEIENNVIKHKVMNASDPSRVGKELIREAIFEDNTLTLIGKGEFGIAKLSWNKIKRQSEFKKTFFK